MNHNKSQSTFPVACLVLIFLSYPKLLLSFRLGVQVVMRQPTSCAENFSQQWSAFVATSSNSLERNDKAQISRITSLDDVQQLFIRPSSSPFPASTSRELSSLALALEKIENFAVFVSDQAKPPTDNSIFWGLVGILVKLSQSEEEIATRIPRMLRVACQNIDLLNKCRERATKALSETRDTCFDIAHSLVSLLTAVIRSIRKDVDCNLKDRNAWKLIEEQFSNFNCEVNEAISRIEKLSKFSEFEDLTQLHSTLAALPKLSLRQSQEELASLPCFIYPMSRTARFFDRTEDIIEMDRFFCNGVQDTEQPFRSIALHGVAGVGKSSVALRYAENRIHRKELDAMFWISGEKEVTVRQSFTDIAVRLKLPGARPKDHDQNRTLVLDWLQNTECQWLLIFDNVESVDLLMTYWPIARRGQAILTTRNHNFAFDPTDGGLEVISWDAEKGSHFLLHLLSSDIGKQLTEKEASGAHDLSLQLSGHALALSLMAGLIHRRSWSIEEFLEIYNRQPQKVIRMFGNDSINALWNMSFRSLSEKTSAVLGVLTFLSPDSIPQKLFENTDPSVLPDSLKFCVDPFDFSDEMETLMTLALVKRNREQRTFSIHRLVQTSFRQFMGRQGRQRSFNDATLLVSAAFPRKDAKFAQMYHRWGECARYLPQVLSLRDSFREEKKSDPEFSALMLYCDLNNACQRYLIECNGYNDLLALVEVNHMALQTIPPQPWTVYVDLEGSLASHWGQVLGRTGQAEEGVKHLKVAYDLFCKDDPRNLQEEAWCAENLADGYASTNDFLDALKFQEEARDRWLDWAKDNSKDKTEWPAILKWGMGNNLIWAGRNGEAKDILSQGLDQLEAAEPYNWAMVAYTNYALGTLNRLNRDFESAEKHFTEAHNKWISGDNLLSDPFCGACVYRMGCAALDQGKAELAIKHLREACIITERHRIKMPAEYARSLFKLSEALGRDPRQTIESAKRRDESQRILTTRIPQAGDIDDEKTFDDLVFIWWR
ncbi:NB-ARC and TPR domain protein [Polychaeton citri CBS 116435]|uniref:NB-ARC and TPR domain protein n=1 Tax=Polychaeton citri CBS 116435 TaxID=1314669 RepID=A0A9P4UQA9_9PEZI|nr:NB-ARC and TPR domain protein [Polychaeton citri CBS 116435]